MSDTELTIPTNKSRFNKEEFIKKARAQYGQKYDYSQVDILDATKRKIICPKHGPFYQRPWEHLNTVTNNCCPECQSNLRNRKTPNHNITNKEFIIRSRRVHGSKYNYSMVDYIGSKHKVKIVCPVHGDFLQTPGHHWRGQGCPLCKNKSENQINEILKEMRFSFVYQKKFNESPRCWTFDFYFPGLNLVIEFDGEQHFYTIKGWGNDKDSLSIKQKTDEEKDAFLSKIGVDIIRIPYWLRGSLRETLEDVFSELPIPDSTLYKYSLINNRLFFEENPNLSPNGSRLIDLNA